MSDCLFCRIAAGEIPATLVYEDDTTLAFEDINPQAPTHTLVVPRAHVADLKDADAGDEALLGHLLAVAAKIARDKGLASFRTVINTGAEAGQTVFHLHLHLLAGRQMHWPPG
jgi:histidine triad (HIT) family protein